MTARLHEAAKAHFLRRICATPLQHIPAPHVHIRQIFPDAYFTHLLEISRQAGAYTLTRDADTYAQECLALTGKVGERHHMWIQPSCASENEDTFLCGLAAWLTTADVLNALHTAYRAPLLAQSACSPGGASVRLVRESGVGYIRPHIDKPFKVMTLVFFLSEGTDASCPGTELYADTTSNDTTALPKMCAPFEGNSVLIMPRTPNSWHGVRAKVLDHPRNTLHVYIKAEQAGFRPP